MSKCTEASLSSGLLCDHAVHNLREESACHLTEAYLHQRACLVSDLIYKLSEMDQDNSVYL